MKKDQDTQKEIQKLKTQLENYLDDEVEKKARYTKQAYYELGPKSTKLLARKLRKQQADSTIFKIKDPSTQKLQTEPKEIENSFYQYYSKLYSLEGAPNKDSIRAFIDKLDLPCIGEIQNKRILAEITSKELDKAISRLKTNKARLSR